MNEVIEYNTYEMSLDEIVELLDWSYIMACADTYEPVTA